MSKMHLYLERFWLVAAAGFTIFTLIYSFQDGFYHTRLFWLMCGIAWAMFLVRRGIRKRMEKHYNQQQGRKKS